MELNGLKELLDFPRKIVITTHFKPDGDAIGSSLGLYNYLIQKNHDVTVVTPNDFPDFLQWMAGCEKIVDFEKQPVRAKELIANAELIFCLDFNALSRIEDLAPFVEKANATRVLIDHHLDPQRFCDYVYSYPESCATSELVYVFICKMGDKHLINKNVAECLYAGIMTDTASFRFSTMVSETHRIIAELMDAGAKNYKIHELVYDNFSEHRMKFLGYCIKDKLRVFPEYNTGMISVTRAEMKEFHHESGDTEGIVNYALGIKNIRLAAFFVERRDEIKISFRSKDNFSVKELAGSHFEGGGHKNASGGRSTLTMEETIDKFVKILPLYKRALTE